MARWTSHFTRLTAAGKSWAAPNGCCQRRHAGRGRRRTVHPVHADRRRRKRSTISLAGLRTPNATPPARSQLVHFAIGRDLPGRDRKEHRLWSWGSGGSGSWTHTRRGTPFDPATFSGRVVHLDHQRCCADSGQDNDASCSPERGRYAATFPTPGAYHRRTAFRPRRLPRPRLRIARPIAITNQKALRIQLRRHDLRWIDGTCFAATG